MPDNFITEQFDRDQLTRICTMDEADFGREFGMELVMLPESRYVKAPENFYFYKDNGSSVLAVAHLDTVVGPAGRATHYVETGAGLVVFSGALDDRLGAYIILDLLPKLGITYDVLLTVGEESGNSTALWFDPPKGKEYDWMIEFDRGGTDVVMYQYDDPEVRAMVRKCGARVGEGIFSDIGCLDHLGIKGFNWGVGYQDYHSTRGHAFLDDTFQMVYSYLIFHEQNKGTYMPHYEEYTEPKTAERGFWGGGLDLIGDDYDSYNVDADEPDAVMDQLRRELANGVHD